MYVRRLELADAPSAPTPAWALEVPAVRGLQAGPLDLSAPITVLTGDNGVGKSTVLEAIAMHYGFSPDGGPLAVLPPQPWVNPLRHCTTLVRGDKAADGYFLRAESHYRVAATFARTRATAENWLHRSHGESVFGVVEQSFSGRGLFLLDEPESGLSLVRQMALLAEIHQAAQAGAQFIVVTHSPVLVGLPGAVLYEFTAPGPAGPGGIQRLVDVFDTSAYRQLVAFLNAQP
ncbi:AAA family ATPase [Corynebacterium lizhenjunii]|uniref:AAA family ATPase n=1 Tax=Corynebacterium lizhenjunii TaxID=2709394 RepID=A0A7T0KET8_9CORY|nr:AAA family ATPase [Corynebacterium lizhenjunii]QPK79312.1 AAA family ATPase [Corynebacterium lizhenjunii]